MEKRNCRRMGLEVGNKKPLRRGAIGVKTFGI